MSHFCTTFETLAAWRCACAPAARVPQLRSDWCALVGDLPTDIGAALFGLDRWPSDVRERSCKHLSTLWHHFETLAASLVRLQRRSTRCVQIRSAIGLRSSGKGPCNLVGAALFGLNRWPSDVRERSCKQCRTFAHTLTLWQRRGAPARLQHACHGCVQIGAHWSGDLAILRPWGSTVWTGQVVQ